MEIYVSDRVGKSVCVCVFLDFKSCHHQKGGDWRSKLHDESRLIQRCFDDNKDDNKRWWQRWWQKAQRSIKEWVQDVQDRIKNTSRFKSRIKIQEIKISRINIQEIKIQESREGLIKISMKRFSQKLNSTCFFLKHVYQRVFTLWYGLLPNQYKNSCVFVSFFPTLLLSAVHLISAFAFC